MHFDLFIFHVSMLAEMFASGIVEIPIKIKGCQTFSPFHWLSPSVCNTCRTRVVSKGKMKTIYLISCSNRSKGGVETALFKKTCRLL